MSMQAAMADGSCRNTIGVWGDRSCAELREHTHCRNCPVYAETGRRLLDREASAAHIQDWQAQLALPPTPLSAAHTSVVVFRVGAEWLAFPTRLLREIIEPTPVHRVPHRHDPRFGGLINVRGELIPCIELGRMLSLGQDTVQNNKAWARMLIIERQGLAWAFRVDDVEGVQRIADSTLRPPPVTVGTGSPSFTAQVFSLDFDFVYLPDSSADSAAQRVSGRGVQLDAVRSLVSESRGAIKVHSVKQDVGLLDEDLLLLAITEVCR